MNWDKLKTFYQVAKLGNITKASKKLHISQSAISKRITDLETQIKIKLFKRTVKGLLLTYEGKILFKTVNKIFSDLLSTEKFLHDIQHELLGTLKISTTPFFTNMILIDLLTDFLKKYSKINLTIISKDQFPDFNVEETDVIIHTFMPKLPASFIQDPLIKFHWKLYASSSYIKKFGMPKTHKELDKHKLITFGTQNSRPFEEINWMLYIGRKANNPRKPYMTINSTQAIYKAAVAGLGIITLSEEYVKGFQKSNLIPVLPQLTGPIIDGRYIYHQNMGPSKKIILLRDWIKKRINRQSK